MTPEEKLQYKKEKYDHKKDAFNAWRRDQRKEQNKKILIQKLLQHKFPEQYDLRKRASSDPPLQNCMIPIIPIHNVNNIRPSSDVAQNPQWPGQPTLSQYKRQLKDRDHRRNRKSTRVTRSHPQKEENT